MHRFQAKGEVVCALSSATVSPAARGVSSQLPSNLPEDCKRAAIATQPCTLLQLNLEVSVSLSDLHLIVAVKDAHIRSLRAENASLREILRKCEEEAIVRGQHRPCGAYSSPLDERLQEKAKQAREQLQHAAVFRLAGALSRCTMRPAFCAWSMACSSLKNRQRQDARTVGLPSFAICQPSPYGHLRSTTSRIGSRAETTEGQGRLQVLEQGLSVPATDMRKSTTAGRSQPTRHLSTPPSIATLYKTKSFFRAGSSQDQAYPKIKISEANGEQNCERRASFTSAHEASLSSLAPFMEPRPHPLNRSVLHSLGPTGAAQKLEERASQVTSSATQSVRVPEPAPVAKSKRPRQRALAATASGPIERKVKPVWGAGWAVERRIHVYATAGERMQSITRRQPLRKTATRSRAGRQSQTKKDEESGDSASAPVSAPPSFVRVESQEMSPRGADESMRGNHIHEYGQDQARSLSPILPASPPVKLFIGGGQTILNSWRATWAEEADRVLSQQQDEIKWEEEAGRLDAQPPGFLHLDALCAHATCTCTPGGIGREQSLVQSLHTHVVGILAQGDEMTYDAARASLYAAIGGMLLRWCRGFAQACSHVKCVCLDDPGQVKALACMVEGYLSCDDLVHRAPPLAHSLTLHCAELTLRLTQFCSSGQAVPTGTTSPVKG